MELALGDVKLSVSYLAGDSLQVITEKENGIKVTLRQVGRKYGHYTLIQDGIDLDFGIYNTCPDNIPPEIEKQYLEKLRRNGWDKRKSGNCCLPMCIIISVLMHQHQQETNDFKIAEKLQATENAQNLEKTKRKHEQESNDFEIASILSNLKF
jgi:hypothetical protein